MYKIHSFINKFSSTFIILLISITSWLCGVSNINLLKYWFCLTMPFVLLLRFYDYIKKKYYHFLIELCYFINFLTIYFLIYDIDLKLLFPFLHGTFICYSLFLKDKIILNNMDTTTTFLIHSFSTITTHKIYWSTNNYLTIFSLNVDSFIYYLKKCELLYLTWFIPYIIYAINAT